MTTPVPDDSLQLSDQLCFAAYAAANAFKSIYKPLLDPLGLTYPQYLVLLVLWDKDDVTVAEIGRQLSLDSGTLTPLLKRLEVAGIVLRKRDLVDGRLVRIKLTEKGLQLRQPVAQARRKVACATGLPSHELDLLKAQILQVIGSLEARSDRLIG